MKFKFDNKYFHIGVTAFFVLAAGMLLYYTIFHMKTVVAGIKFFLTIIAPIIYGFVIAYILSSVVNFLEAKVFFKIMEKKGINLEKRGKRITRWCCVLLSMCFFFAMIYTLIMMILPQLIKSITSIIYSFPSYVNSLEKWMNSIIERGWNLDARSIEVLNQYSKQLQNYLTGTILPRLQDMLVNISSGVFNFLTIVKNFLIGAIVSLYLLVDKEKFIAKAKMILYALFSVEHVNDIIHSMRFTHEIFGGFISGKLLDSAIIGVLCYIGITIMNIPYTILVSVVIGVTNIIPFFGPYLGAIPCSLLILLVSPMKGLYFIIFILILQQFDGNILGPKILGDSTGLSSFMVIVAILIGGGLFGIGGMVIGVPVCAVIYASLNNILARSLRDKELPSEEKEYINIDCLDPMSHNALELVKKPTFMEQHREERNTAFMKVYTFLRKVITKTAIFIYTYSKKYYRIASEFCVKKFSALRSFIIEKVKEAKEKAAAAKKKENVQAEPAVEENPVDAAKDSAAAPSSETVGETEKSEENSDSQS